jgi:lipopolysaccharide biosynthesis glycosyltransferase
MAYGDRTIWVGYDTREVLPYAVARHSLQTWSEQPMPIGAVDLREVQALGWYDRPTEARKTKQGGEVMWDIISDASMSTEFAISRFFVPMLAKAKWPANRGWALFVDCDVLARNFIDDLFTFVEHFPDKALFCVPHAHHVVEGEAKMDSQIQMNYTRKNWSSVMLFNLKHPKNDQLQPDLINKVPGRDLHRFCWLDDEDIGFLDVKWNHLVGVVGAQSSNPSLVHFTNGGPWLKDYADVEYASEWRNCMHHWVRG